MKKLLARVYGYAGQSGTFRPIGWLAMPISDACVNVKSLINEGTGMSMSTWSQVYSTISKEIAKSPWQPIYKNPFKIDDVDGAKMINFEKHIIGPVQVGDFMVMDEHEYYLRCDKKEG